MTFIYSADINRANMDIYERLINQVLDNHACRHRSLEMFYTANATHL